MDKLTNRIDAIDFAKGILVLLMVAYHTLNYLGYDSLPHYYMAFLPLSFIMIAGFLVMQVYASKQGPVFAGVGARLAIRALKLLLLFTALNLAARAVWSRNNYGDGLSIHEFVTNWFEVYVTAQARNVAFDVLVPISYTLLLATGILAMRAVKPTLPLVLAVAVFVLCALLDLTGHPVNNLHFISAGVIGLWFGTLELGEVDRAAKSWKVLITLVTVYVLIMLLALDNYVSQIFVTVASLIALYAVGRILSAERWWVRQVYLLGRYTLMSYIVQILLLQWAKAIDRFGSVSPIPRAVGLMFLVAVLMWGIVWLVDYGRLKTRGVDRLYKTVFA